jgi:hypothetical protein
LKRDTKEPLVAYLLWCCTLLAYVYSFYLPWFDFGRENRVPLPVWFPPLELDARSLSDSMSGDIAFCFIVERTAGGSLVGFAHPLLWIGLVLLALRRWRGAMVAGCLALLCAMNAVLLFQPREGPWFAPKFGYYLWFLSMIVLASSNFLRNCLCSDNPAHSRVQLDRLTAEQQALAMQIDNLKQLTDEAVDLQAANILLEMSARDTEGKHR